MLRSLFNLWFVPGFNRAILRIIFFRKSRQHFLREARRRDT